MNFDELVSARRSVRSFTGRDVSEDEIYKLLGAAVSAPNACNYQSWHFYVVRGRELIGGFVPAVYRGEWFRSAAVVFVVCADAEALSERFGVRGRDLFALQDTACAADHLMLMAAELGLGSCFVGAFDEGECRKYLDIPEGRRPVALIPVGHPAEELPKRERKPIPEAVTFVGGSPIPDGATRGERKPFALKSASLPGAVFDDLNLLRSTFSNINMKGCRFSDINMAGASFGGMTMQGSDFGCVDMRGTKFENPDFTDALFRNCNLRKVKIENSDIGGMTVDGVDISELIKNHD